MPAANYPLQDWVALGGLAADPTVPPVVVDAGGMRLRRVGSDGVRFEFDGILEVSGVARTPSFQMRALREVFGIRTVVVDRVTRFELDSQDHLGFQVTLDGAVYLTWDGGDWVEDDLDGDYTAPRDFDENCGSLTIPGVGATLGFRVKLTALDADPVLLVFEPYVEWRHEDLHDYHHTIRLALEQARFPAVFREQLSADAEFVVIESTFTADTAVDAVARNLTDDPLKLVNIFDSWEVVGQDLRLNFTVEQAADSVIEYELRGTCPITVAQRDELVDISSIPHVVATVGPPEQVQGSWSGQFVDIKDGTSTRLSRTRIIPPTRQVRVDLELWTATPMEATRGADLLRSAMEDLRSAQTGQRLRVDFLSETALMEARGPGLFRGEWSCLLMARIFPSEYTEAPLVNEVTLIPKGPQERWPSEIIEVAR